jgi:plasmid maintenance system killer protein
LGKRYLQTLRKHRDLIRQVKKATRLLLTQPDSNSLNFEKLSGMPGFYSIRVNLAFRILLQRLNDEKGPYWLLVELDTHRIYQR